MRHAPTPDAPWDPRFAGARPEFAPVRDAASHFHAFRAWPTPDDWNAALGRDPALRSAGGARVRFVPQPPRRARKAPVDPATLYDARIYAAGEVPSRAQSWHDFFNMLVWASFPRAKRGVNARQYAALRAWAGDAPRLRLPPARTPEQDALAMLDEGGLLLLCDGARSPDARASLRDGDAAALADLRAGGALHALVFGHALYEHFVVAGDAPVRALGVLLAAPAGVPADPRAARELADALLAAALEDPARFARPGADPGVPLDPRLFERGR